MQFWQLHLYGVLTLDPRAPQQAKHRLVRLIAGNPVTMGEITRHIADAGSYAPVTILIQELPDGGAVSPIIRSSARSLPITMRLRRRSPGASTPRY